MDYLAENCSVAATLSVIGEKWTLIVLREIFFGLRRYADLLQATGCARNILGDRLSTMVNNGLLTRVLYRQPGQRLRYEYRLTDKGLDLLPILVALLDWGDHWMAGKVGGPVELRHRECRSRAQVVINATPATRPWRPATSTRWLARAPVGYADRATFADGHNA